MKRFAHWIFAIAATFSLLACLFAMTIQCLGVTSNKWFGNSNPEAFPRLGFGWYSDSKNLCISWNRDFGNSLVPTKDEGETTGVMNPRDWAFCGLEFHQTKTQQTIWNANYDPRNSASPFLSDKITGENNSLMLRCSWLTAYAAILPSFWAAMSISRLVGRNRSTSLQCPKCGYDLRATRNRCPECGSAPEQIASQHHVPIPHRKAHRVLTFWENVGNAILRR